MGNRSGTVSGEILRSIKGINRKGVCTAFKFWLNNIDAISKICPIIENKQMDNYPILFVLFVVNSFQKRQGFRYARFEGKNRIA
jgi:hypothetical protein